MYRFASLLLGVLLSVGVQAQDFGDQGQDCTLAWDAPLTGTAGGYHVRAGTVAGIHANITDVGNVLTARCSEFNVVTNGTYFVVVNAYPPGDPSSRTGDTNEVQFSLSGIVLGDPSNLIVGP